MASEFTNMGDSPECPHCGTPFDESDFTGFKGWMYCQQCDGQVEYDIESTLIHRIRKIEWGATNGE